MADHDWLISSTKSHDYGRSWDLTPGVAWVFTLLKNTYQYQIGINNIRKSNTSIDRKRGDQWFIFRDINIEQ